MGGTSNEYAQDKYGTFTLIVELPYWDDPRASDPSPTEISKRVNFVNKLEADRKHVEWAQAQLDAVQGELRLSTPFHRAVADNLEYVTFNSEGERRWLETADGLDQPATRAERFGFEVSQEFERQRLRGMLMRLLDAEIAAGNDAPEIHAARETVANELYGIGRDSRRTWTTG